MEKDISLERLCSLKEDLVTVLESQIRGNLDAANTKELGEVVDMVKDICEAKKYAMESMYYESVVKAMKEPEAERYGYRHMPKPYVDQEPYVERYLNPRMGYHGMTNPMNETSDYRYGYSYTNYNNARRHYTQTHNPEDKREMDKHANQHLADTIATMRDIWHDAEPELRKRMKNDIQKLLDEMNE